MEKRAQEAQKRKLALRDEILRVRGEREQVALYMDEIRIQHEKETKLAQASIHQSWFFYFFFTNFSQGRNKLNASVHDIELAVERGKSDQDANEPTKLNGMELLLKRLAGEVSNKSDSGGILKQVKEFNAFLERAALALEARKG